MEVVLSTSQAATDVKTTSPRDRMDSSRADTRAADKSTDHLATVKNLMEVDAPLSTRLEEDMANRAGTMMMVVVQAILGDMVEVREATRAGEMTGTMTVSPMVVDVETKTRMSLVDIVGTVGTAGTVAMVGTVAMGAAQDMGIGTD